MTSRSLHIYGGAEFALALQTGMDTAADGSNANTDKATTKGRRAIKHPLSALGLNLRKAMVRAVRSSSGGDVDNMMVVLVDTPDRAVRDTIRDIVEHVPSIVEARQGKLTEDAIDALVSVYMRTPPNTEVERLLYDSNAQARVRFLNEWPCFTSKDLAAAAGHGSKNKSMTASRWKAKGKVFSVKQGGVEYFPAFQFAEGQPVETIGKVLETLGGRKSGWQLAFWFTSPNGWLDGKRPADIIDDMESVARAAAREAEDIIG
jgi:hypothetical protein